MNWYLVLNNVVYWLEYVVVGKLDGSELGLWGIYRVLVLELVLLLCFLVVMFVFNIIM